MRHLHKILKITSAFCVAGLLMQSCHHAEAPEKDTKFEVTDTLLKSLLMDTVQQANAVSQLTLTGSIAPDENKMVKVFPMVSGVVQGVHVQLGDVVQKGQTLGVLKSAEAAGFSKDLISSQADLRSAKRTLESTKEMYQGGLASQKDLEDAQSDYDKAVAENKRAGVVTSINTSNGEGYVIKAPLTGFVVDKNVTDNSEVRADNGQNLFTIADLTDVYVLINIYESDISNVKVGDPVKITTLSYPDKVFDGKIDKIDNILDPDSKVIHARVKIANPGNMLKPDMFANVSIKGTTGADLPFVKADALIFDNDKYYVLVVDGKAHVRIQPVTVAKKVEDRAYISNGIKPGDIIVASRQLFLYESLKD